VKRVENLVGEDGSAESPAVAVSVGNVLRQGHEEGDAGLPRAEVGIK
jgi:hypothetical protein